MRHQAGLGGETGLEIASLSLHQQDTEPFLLLETKMVTARQGKTPYSLQKSVLLPKQQLIITGCYCGNSHNVLRRIHSILFLLKVKQKTYKNPTTEQAVNQLGEQPFSPWIITVAKV